MSFIIYPMGLWAIFLLVLPVLYIIVLKLHPVPSREPEIDYTPQITVIVPAHNEADHIPRKLEQLFEQFYPSDKIEIVVVDDGSTDQTLSILESYKSKVNVISFKTPRGKIAALNQGLNESHSEIVVITDADTELEKQSIRELVRPFQDAGIGAVSGRLRIRGEGKSARYERAYVESEHTFRENESLLSSVPFLFGQLSAFRRKVLPQINSMAAVDDIEMALVIQERGYRVISAPEAIVYEEAPASLRQLFHQKRRRGACTIEVVLRHLEIIRPRNGWFALTFLVRRVLPFFLPVLLLLEALFLILTLGAYWAAVLLATLFLISWLKNRNFTEYMAIIQFIVVFSWLDYLRGNISKGANWKQQ